MLFGRTTSQLPSSDQALKGRSVRPFEVPERHVVLGTPLEGPVPGGLEVAYFGMGCFWGAEELYWRLPGVWSTAVGYQGGLTPHPTYEEVCTGLTGHDETVRIVYDPAVVSYHDLLRLFWESHDPTQGFRQGNDVGTQYRSAIYWTSERQRDEAEATRAAYQKVLTAAGLDSITTEVLPAPQFFYAEGYHQQYLAKNPHGYRCHANTGLKLPETS